MAMVDEKRVPIRSDADIVVARREGRALAAEVGFSGSDLTVIATAISEVSRNIVQYAREGEVILGTLHNGAKRGLLVIAQDRGPGIPDIEKALQDGFSTGGSLGLGLPGARRLMDEFELTSKVGEGTTVIMKKWTR